MRKLLFILSLFFSLTLQATTWYLDDTGSDASGNGSIGSPWRNLSKALTVAVSGDVIHFKEGPYPINVMTYIPTGISLEGEGDGSLITSSYTGSGDLNRDATLRFQTTSSSAMGTGNQSVSNLKFYGGSSYTAKTAISVINRGAVEIHNCTFENFYHSAVIFYAGTSTWIIDETKLTEAEQFLEGTYAEGNSYHDNISSNCSRNLPPATWQNTGHVYIQGQKDLLIHHNTMTQTQRPAGYNGMCIKGVEGFFKGLKIYNNTMIQTPVSNEVGFTLELWFPRGGIEIYNNTFPMQCDLARSIVKAEYSFAAKIYNNTIGHATLPPLAQSKTAIHIEWEAQDVYVYNNRIRNYPIGFKCTSTGRSVTFERIYVYYNLFYNITGTEDIINFWYGYPEWPCVYRDIHIYNNVVYGNGNYSSRGICLPSSGTGTNFYIKNNIIMTNKPNGGAPIRGVNSAFQMNNLVITNNIFWNCGNLNNPDLLPNYTQNNYTYASNIKADPLFISPSTYNFDINANSPAIGTGIHLPFSFITRDFDSVLISSPPEIGAYEYGIPSPFVLPTVTTTAITNILLTTATGGGNVTDDGGASVTARGVCWNTVANPTTANSKTTDGAGLGTFTSSLTGLTQNTTYYVKAYATNSVNTAYGSEVTFTTGPPEQAEVATGTPIRLTDSTATGSGNVISAGGGTVSARGVCWSISADPTLSDDFATAAAGGLGEYTAAMTGLSQTIYYVRAWATNETTTVYGSNVIFDMSEGQLLRGSEGTLIRDASGNLIRVK